MTDVNTEPSEVPEEDESAEVDPTHDWFLAMILDMVNKFELSMDITLTVGGTVVSGRLIGGRTYFNEMQQAMLANSNDEGDAAAALAENFASLAHIYDKPDDAPDDWTLPRPGYVHLRDARYFAPGQAPMPSDNGMLWRGKLSSVDGFSLGMFTHRD